MKEVKCEHCANWTNGLKDNCNFCNGVLNQKYKLEKEEQIKSDTGFNFPLIKIDASEPWYFKIPKHVFRFGQMIFFAIVTGVAYLAAGTVG